MKTSIQWAGLVVEGAMRCMSPCVCVCFTLQMETRRVSGEDLVRLMTLQAQFSDVDGDEDDHHSLFDHSLDGPTCG